MTRTIKAIETEYAGYRMRSRLEARWAMFFDGLRLTWQYEPEGFTDGEEKYLPDFYIADFEAYAEVKPPVSVISEREAMKMLMMLAGGKDILLCSGTPGDASDGGMFLFSAQIVPDAAKIYERAVSRGSTFNEWFRDFCFDAQVYVGITPSWGYCLYNKHNNCVIFDAIRDCREARFGT